MSLALFRSTASVPIGTDIEYGARHGGDFGGGVVGVACLSHSIEDLSQSTTLTIESENSCDSSSYHSNSSLYDFTDGEEYVPDEVVGRLGAIDIGAVESPLVACHPSPYHIDACALMDPSMLRLDSEDDEYDRVCSSAVSPSAYGTASSLPEQRTLEAMAFMMNEYADLGASPVLYTPPPSLNQSSEKQATTEEEGAAASQSDHVAEARQAPTSTAVVAPTPTREHQFYFENDAQCAKWRRRSLKLEMGATVIYQSIDVIKRMAIRLDNRLDKRLRSIQAVKSELASLDSRIKTAPQHYRGNTTKAARTRLLNARKRRAEALRVQPGVTAPALMETTLPALPAIQPILWCLPEADETGCPANVDLVSYNDK